MKRDHRVVRDGRHVHAAWAAILSTWVLLLAVAFVPSASAQDGDPDRDWQFIQKLQEDGMADLAVRELSNFAAKHPRDPRAPVALLRAAEGMAGLGQPAGSLPMLDRLLREYPSSEQAPAAALKRADVLVDTGRLDDAADAYRSLLSAYPASDEVEAARLGLAEALMADGDDVEARRLLSRLVGGRASDEVGARALFDLALLDRRAGADSLAIERFDAIHERHPGRPIAAFGLLRAADMLIEREAPGAARARYERLLDSFGEPVVRARAHLGLARLLEDEDPARAAIHFRSVAEEGGAADDVQTALLGLARTSLAAGDYEAARAAAVAYIEKYPMTERVHRARLLRVRADLAEDDEGTDGYDAFMQIGSTSPDEVAFEAYSLAATAAVDAGRTDDAFTAWRRAEIAAPDGERRVQALMEQAALALRLGRAALSADLARTAHAASSTDAERAKSLLAVVEAEIQAERFAPAREAATTLVTTHPLSAEATRARARLRALRGVLDVDRDVALRELATAVRQPEGDATARNLALASTLMDGLGRPDLARESLREALDDADTPEARGRLELLLARALRREALDLALRGNDDQAAKRWAEARDVLIETAARSAAEEVANRARLELVAVDIADVAVPGSPWVFDTETMPLLGAVGEAEAVDLSSSDFDRIRRRLDQALESETPVARDWVTWRWAEVTTAPLEERIARLEAIVDDAAPRYAAPLRATLGQLLLESGDAVAAARALGRVVDDAGSEELAMSVRYALAEAQRAERRYAQAGTLYAEFAGAYPDSDKGQRALLLAGDCSLYVGRSDEAVTRYRQLLERYPESAFQDDALYRLGTALHRAGKREAAREPLERLIATDSVYRGRALARLGDIEHVEGNVDAAVAAYTQLAEADPEHADTEGGWTILAELELERGQPAAALAWLDRREPRLESDASTLALRVRAAARADRTTNAESALERLALGFPDAGDAIARARMDLADARFAAGNDGAAMEGFERAATETDDATLRARAAYGQAMVHARAQRWADARAAFERTEDIAPNSTWAAEALFKLGQYYGRLDDPQSAQRAFATLVERFPRSEHAVEALRGEARAWRLLNRFDEALERYHRILEEHPDIEDGADVLSNIAYCHHEMGQFEVAIAAYRRVLPLLDEEGQAYAQFWIADGMDKLGQHLEAATEFLRIPYLYSTQGQLPVTAQLRAGESYEKVPDPEAARRLYERVLAAHGPNSQWGAEAQRRLDRLAGGDRGSR